VVETGFLISRDLSIPENIPAVGPSSSHQASESEGELNQPEVDFGIFELSDESEDPSGDIGDPALSEAELMLIGTSTQAEMRLKRKPTTSLLELLEGPSGKGAQGTSQHKAPSPPPQPQTV